MQAEPTSPRLSLFQLQLLDSLAVQLLGSLDVADRADRIVDFLAGSVAHEAALTLNEDRVVTRRAVSASSAGFDSGATSQLALAAHGERIGTLRLVGLRPPCESFFLGRLAHYCAYALHNARSYERERRASVTFQNAAIGVPLPSIPGVLFDAVYEAGRSEALVGGDWYDAFALQDGRFVISIGDVAGSGLNAAVAMVNVRQSLRSVAYVHADPILMLKAAEETLRSQYPDRYVTAFVGIADPVMQTLSYANAGHPPPLLRDADGSVRLLLGRSLPLGLHDVDSSIEAYHATLGAGSTIVLYTDGITEATRDPVEGERRLVEAVSSINPTTADLAKTLHTAVLPNHANDDVAILTMHVQSAAQARRWRFDPRWEDVARRARADLLSSLLEEGLDESQVFFIEVICSELMANALRYAEGTVELVLERRAGNFIIHLVDKGPGFHFSPRLPSDLFSERGRGLFLISHLSQDFTVEHRPGGGSHARVVINIEGATS